MNTALVLMFGLLCFIVGIAVAPSLARKIHNKPQEAKPDLPKGLVNFRSVGCGLLNRGHIANVVVEIEELARCAHLSKVNVISVSGDPNNEDIKRYIPEWIPTKDITWIR